MNRNRMYSAMLSVLLIVSGQALCSEPLLPSTTGQTIKNTMWSFMPTTPAWLTNFTSSLSDTQKYFLYGLGALSIPLIAYIWSKLSSKGLGAIGSNEENYPERQLWSPDLTELNSSTNRGNIAIIIDEYRELKLLKNPAIKKVFIEYACPVFHQFQDELDDKNKWDNYLTNFMRSSEGRVLLVNKYEVGFKLHQLIKGACPNGKITNPLNELLQEKIKDEKLLEILNQ